jgi:transcriptional accessory protein Tex/SPT6
MKANDSDKYKGKYPLLALDIRFKTISKYLCYELYVYPELRKVLREKYFKKLVISTTPSIKGNQDIDLYSVFFPIKRIKEKPITTLKREMWILALEAEKKDLVKI